jgi:large subunit ribosomal protein L10
VAVDTAAPEHRRATVRPDKAEVVTELAEAFRTSAAAVLTEYRGLSVKQITALRVALGTDTSYTVVKNTLTTLAADQAGLEGLSELLSGPTAVAFVSGDPVEAAKSLRDFARTNPQLVVKGGVMDGKPLTADEVRRLADLESREVLLAKLAGAMLASLSQAVYLLNAPLAQVARLAGALQAKAEEDPSVLAGGAGTPAAPSDTAADAGPSDAASSDAGSSDVPDVSDVPAGDEPDTIAAADAAALGDDGDTAARTVDETAADPSA